MKKHSSESFIKPAHFLGLGMIVLILILSACGNSEQSSDPGIIQDTEAADVLKENEVELFYDDGTMEAHHSPWTDNTGGQLAVVFTPPFYPAVLTSAQFLVGVNGIPTTTLRVRVYKGSVSGGPDEDQDLLSSEMTASALFGHQWVEVDFSDQNVIITSGDFRIAMEWLTPPGNRGENAQFLGMDYSKPDRRSWWKTDSSSNWKRIGEVADVGDRDCMIRATVIKK